MGEENARTVNTSWNVDIFPDKRSVDFPELEALVLLADSVIRLVTFHRSALIEELIY